MLNKVVEEDRYNVDKYLGILSEAIQVFHPQHAVICDISMWLVPIFCRGRPVHLFPVQELALKRQLCQLQLAVQSEINPGLNRAKGSILLMHNV